MIPTEHCSPKNVSSPPLLFWDTSFPPFEQVLGHGQKPFGDTVDHLGRHPVSSVPCAVDVSTERKREDGNKPRGPNG